MIQDEQAYRMVRLKECVGTLGFTVSRQTLRVNLQNNVYRFVSLYLIKKDYLIVRTQKTGTKGF